MSQLTPTASSERPRSRLAASPSMQTPHELWDTTQFGEGIPIPDQLPRRRKSVASRAVSRASYKSLTVISSPSDNGDKEEESSGDHIESSELYDAKAHSSSDSSKHSFFARSAASQTPIADRFSASIRGMHYHEDIYSSGRNASGLSNYSYRLILLTY